MGDWPGAPGGRLSSAVAAASSTGVSVAAPGTAHTKGAWVELVASSPYDASWVMVTAETPSTTGVTSALLDIGVGAAGSETVLIGDLLIATGSQIAETVTFPLHVPAGTRVAARAQAAALSVELRVAVWLGTGGWASPSPHHRVLTMGAVPADSGGTEIDPGGTANVKGAWTQITASTAADLAALVMAVGHRGNGALRHEQLLFDVGVGAAGSEQVLVPDWVVSVSLSETLTPPWTPVLPVSVPAGSRLAVRSQCSDPDASDRLMDVVLYGVVA